VQATGADAVFIGGLICENGAQLIKDKVAVLGPNDGDVKLLTPDGFATQQTIDNAGSASAGMFMSVAGQPIDQFTGKAKEFADNFAKQYLKARSQKIDPYAIYGARSDVIAKMFETKVSNGLLGSFAIGANGDPEGGEGAVTAIVFYKATDKLTTETVISPAQATVDAALGK
jgi:ABC-type branched-subunit amino acid transport system substrate-binding protein